MQAQRATGLAAASNDSKPLLYYSASASAFVPAFALFCKGLTGTLLAGGWEKKQRRIQKRLRLVQQELLAVRGAVEGFDTAAQGQ